MWLIMEKLSAHTIFYQFWYDGLTVFQIVEYGT